MKDHNNFFIELEVASNDTNSEMCKFFICIDRMVEYYYTTYDYNIIII